MRLPDPRQGSRKASAEPEGPCRGGRRGWHFAVAYVCLVPSSAQVTAGRRREQGCRFYARWHRVSSMAVRRRLPGVPGRQVVVATQQQTDSVRPRGRGRRHPAGPGSSCGRRGGPDQVACSPAARGLRSGNLPALVLIGGMHGGQRVPVHDAVPQRGQSPASPSRSCPCRPCPPGRHRAARGGRRRTRRPVVVEVPLVWMVQLIRWPGCFLPSASSVAALPRNRSRHRGPSRNRR